MPYTALDYEGAYDNVEHSIFIRVFDTTRFKIYYSEEEKHYRRMSKEIADKVVFMDGGQILEMAPPDEFFGNPKNARLKEFLSKVL